MKTQYIIQDWAGNTKFNGEQFDSFVDAYDFLLGQVATSSDEDLNEEKMDEYLIVESK